MSITIKIERSVIFKINNLVKYHILKLLCILVSMIDKHIAVSNNRIGSGCPNRKRQSIKYFPPRVILYTIKNMHILNLKNICLIEN